MNAPLLVEPPRGLLENLLAEHFCATSLGALLGEDAASLPRELWTRALGAPVGEFVARPGKALRAELMARSYELAGGAGTCPERAQAIVEILHAGSLIVDDIEDASASRRGAPALHRLYGLPVALNAGNWMYFWALGMIELLRLDRGREIAAHQLAHRMLIACHHGQALDLTANVCELPQAEVPAVVSAAARLKTGALMGLAAGLGALLARASAETVEALISFGQDVGVALQMLDDISGLVREERCHKGHEDLFGGRPTWPWGWLAAELDSRQFSQLQALGKRVARGDLHPEVLARLMRGKLRGSSRVRMRRFIHQAFARIEIRTPNKVALTALRAHLQRMEMSYARG